MKKIGVLGLMAALAVTGAVAFLPKGVMAAEDSDQTISQGVYIGDVDLSLIHISEPTRRRVI